jgi:hypothetical protein
LRVRRWRCLRRDDLILLRASDPRGATCLIMTYKEYELQRCKLALREAQTQFRHAQLQLECQYASLKNELNRAGLQVERAELDLCRAQEEQARGFDASGSVD